VFIMKLFFLVFCFSFYSFSQSLNDAIDFLRVNEPNWACETVAQGTSIKRLSLSLDDSKFLNLKIKLPEYTKQTGFLLNQIDLSKVIRIDINISNKNCQSILIFTKPNGIKSYRVSKLGEKTQLSDAFFIENGWFNDFFKLNSNISFKENSNRVKKALEFLAISNGAILEKQYF